MQKTKYISITSIMIVSSLILQPIQYSRAGDISSSLVPHMVSSGVKMTEDTIFDKLNDTESDMDLLSFAIRAYKMIIEDKVDLDMFFQELKKLSYWKGFWLKEYLDRDFVDPQPNGILDIKLKNNGLIRVIDSTRNVCDMDTGVVEEDGIVPDRYYSCDRHLVQYFKESDLLINVEKEEFLSIGQPRHMINFAPGLSYNALELNEDLKGIYITAEQGDHVYDLKLVCGNEGKISLVASQIMDFMNEALDLLQVEVVESKPSFEILNYKRELSDMIKGMIKRKVYIESAFDFSANSSLYYPARDKECIVFDNGFLMFLNDIHRSDMNGYEPECVRNSGEVIVLAERLFHEINHHEDEVIQIMKDVFLYDAMMKGHVERLNAVKRDVVCEMVGEGTTKEYKFGEYYGTNRYFRMMKKISETFEILGNDLETDTIVESIVKNYIEKNNRQVSGKAVSFLSTEEMDSLAAMLLKHGINDVLSGEQLSGYNFTHFLALHSLFAYNISYDDSKILEDRKKYINWIYKKNNIKEIRKELMRVASRFGEEEKMKKDLNGKNAKRKLYPLMLWAAQITYPQSYERGRGKLFDCIYYKGMNLLMLPIFAVDENWDINWDLMRWVHEPGKLGSCIGAPSVEYYRSKKVSLYEYFVMKGDVLGSKALDEVGEAEMSGRPRQLSLFDVISAEEDKTDIEGDMRRIHDLTIEVGQEALLDTMTYILIDRDIPYPEQREIILFMQGRMKRPYRSEMILFRDIEGINRQLEQFDCSSENTVVFVNNKEKVSMVKKDVNVLVSERGSTTNFVNIEGLIGLARSILSKNMNSFREIYEILTGEECSISDMKDLKGFLIPLVDYKVNDIVKYNTLLKEFLQAA